MTGDEILEAVSLCDYQARLTCITDFFTKNFPTSEIGCDKFEKQNTYLST